MLPVERQQRTIELLRERKTIELEDLGSDEPEKNPKSLDELFDQEF